MTQSIESKIAMLKALTGKTFSHTLVVDYKHAGDPNGTDYELKTYSNQIMLAKISSSGNMGTSSTRFQVGFLGEDNKHEFFINDNSVEVGNDENLFSGIFQIARGTQYSETIGIQGDLFTEVTE